MKKGSALIFVIIVFGFFFFSAVFISKIVYNSCSAANALLEREQAFSLAEAGIEKGKTKLAQNPNWYTDLPYYQEDNPDWIMEQAAGEQFSLGEGSFKLVREKDKNRLYSFGRKGKGRVVIKLSFSPPPFGSLGWKEL